VVGQLAELWCCHGRIRALAVAVRMRTGGCPLCDRAAWIQGAPQQEGPQAALACVNEDVQRLWNISRDGAPPAPGAACTTTRHRHSGALPFPSLSCTRSRPARLSRLPRSPGMAARPPGWRRSSPSGAICRPAAGSLGPTIQTLSEGRC